MSRNILKTGFSLFFGICFCIGVCQTPAENQIQETTVQETISVIGVGDIMMGTNFPSDRYLPPNGGRDMFTPVTDILHSGDLTFGNLEGVLLTGKGKVKRCSNPAKCYAFKSPDEYVFNLLDAGFDVVSTANNHANDFGKIGSQNTVKQLESVGIFHAGLIDYPSVIFTKNNVRYGFCAFSPNTGTMKIHNYTKVKEIVSQLESVVDIVIVSFHGGGEGNKFRNLKKKTEFYLGENRGNPYEFARVAIDAGADIVFGHGPHVTRAIDLYKDRFIAYSLGNFATYARFNLNGSKGVSPIIKVNVNKQGEFQNAKIYSTKQVGEGGPRMDYNNKALKEIIYLTKTDIPECPLNITEEGDVYKK